MVCYMGNQPEPFLSDILSVKVRDFPSPMGAGGWVVGLLVDKGKAGLTSSLQELTTQVKGRFQPIAKEKLNNGSSLSLPASAALAGYFGVLEGQPSGC